MASSAAQNSLKQHLDGLKLALDSLLAEKELVEKIVAKLIAVVKNGGTIYSCGNGGSACDAMHLTEELLARYEKERPGIKARHLLDAGTITCWANDYDFSGVFERQAKTLLEQRDALLVFSTSGNSPNILKALGAAKEQGATTIALLGKSGGAAKEIADLPLVIASNSTAHIQEAHIATVHFICHSLESQLFS